jgi:hypothetical protein
VFCFAKVDLRVIQAAALWFRGWGEALPRGVVAGMADRGLGRAGGGGARRTASGMKEKADMHRYTAKAGEEAVGCRYVG